MCDKASFPLFLATALCIANQASANHVFVSRRWGNFSTVTTSMSSSSSTSSSSISTSSLFTPSASSSDLTTPGTSSSVTYTPPIVDPVATVIITIRPSSAGSSSATTTSTTSSTTLADGQSSSAVSTASSSSADGPWASLSASSSLISSSSSLISPATSSPTSPAASSPSSPLAETTSSSTVSSSSSTDLTPIPSLSANSSSPSPSLPIMAGSTTTTTATVDRSSPASAIESILESLASELISPFLTLFPQSTTATPTPDSAQTTYGLLNSPADTISSSAPTLTPSSPSPSFPSPSSSSTTSFISGAVSVSLESEASPTPSGHMTYNTTAITYWISEVPLTTLTSSTASDGTASPTGANVLPPASQSVGNNGTLAATSSASESSSPSSSSAGSSGRSSQSLSPTPTTAPSPTSTPSSDSSASATASSSSNDSSKSSSIFSSSSSIEVTTTLLTISTPSPTVFTGDFSTTTSSSTSTASSTTAAAASSSAPLPPPAVAGIAAGCGTVGFIALVAAAFLARRYYAKRAAQREAMRVYPEVAYLYDPPMPPRIGTESYASSRRSPSPGAGPASGDGGDGGGGPSRGLGVTFANEDGAGMRENDGLLAPYPSPTFPPQAFAAAAVAASQERSDGFHPLNDEAPAWRRPISLAAASSEELRPFLTEPNNRSPPVGTARMSGSLSPRLNMEAGPDLGEVRGGGMWNSHEMGIVAAGPSAVSYDGEGYGAVPEERQLLSPRHRRHASAASAELDFADHRLLGRNF